jgi:hypothetical protein
LMWVASMEALGREVPELAAAATGTLHRLHKLRSGRGDTHPSSGGSVGVSSGSNSSGISGSGSGDSGSGGNSTVERGDDSYAYLHAASTLGE